MDREARKRSVFQVLVLLLGSAAPASAHHSQRPFFHMDRDLEIRGVVAKFEFTNPHPIIYLDVAEAGGDTVQWQIEGPTRIYLMRRGWTPQSIVAGEQVTIRGAPPKKPGAHAMAGREVRKADGTALRLYAEGSQVLEGARARP